MMEYIYSNLHSVVCIPVPAAQLVTLIKVLTLLVQICLVFVTIGEGQFNHHRRAVKTPKTLDDMPRKSCNKIRINYVATNRHDVEVQVRNIYCFVLICQQEEYYSGCSAGHWRSSTGFALC
jgi:hypothetical protein